MIDHITLHVGNYEKAKSFYQALAPLGYEVVMEFPNVGGFGAEGNPDLWISGDGAGKPSHVAFTAMDRKTVDAFHAAGLTAGGKDNGALGIRKDYSPTYYAAGSGRQ